ncbi:DUF2851 family protein [Flavobacteriaceae bacterium]|nr:DUF2851 family protein [Flavobacteriaceae bacterium]MDA8758456.1 DUF2851 family protein [Flavobacteriaceae bacterium]MDA8762879.1 DUF2851 family protein [Flavobacteriaceae bacterium]
MKEDFLHYLWRFQKLSRMPLKTTSGLLIRVVNPGLPNTGEGPDFTHAKMWIGETLWAGAVELHLSASSWYHHLHHLDRNYDAVILHVVWENDAEVCYPSGRLIPCLEMSKYITAQKMEAYFNSFKKMPHWIPCEKYFDSYPDFQWHNWKERLYFERLEQKTQLIFDLLKVNKNNWEATLFQLLVKNFGLNQNGNLFLKWAQYLPFSIIQKNTAEPDMLEALFMGISGLLQGEINSPYKKHLRSHYDYLKQKFGFDDILGMKLNFKGLRPSNFPTIRLSQLAQFYHQNPRPFAQLMEAKKPKDLSWIREVGVSDFWKTHYTFERESASKPKRLSQSFFELLMINTLIPLRFAFKQKQLGTPDEQVIQWIESFPSERNSITKGFSQLGVKMASALDSQALLQLKNFYCDKKRCLRCAVGFYLFDFSP